MAIVQSVGFKGQGRSRVGFKLKFRVSSFGFEFRVSG